MPVKEFSQDLSQTLAKLSSCSVVSSSIVDAIPGTPGFAQVESGNSGDFRLADGSTGKKSNTDIWFILPTGVSLIGVVVVSK